MTALQLREVSSLDAVRPVWTRLANTGAAGVFSTWEWAETWWRHLGRGRPLSLWTCFVDDEVVGTVPLYVWRGRPMRIARFVGHGAADELGPICRPAYREAIAEVIRGRLAGGPFDIVLAEQLPAGSRWSELLGGRALRHEASPILRGAPDWDAFLASRSANFRQQLARRERALRREYRVRFRLTTDQEVLGRDLDTLFRLHHAVRPRSDFGPEAFHREFAATALERGWLRLWVLELDDRAAAAWYGFRFAGAEAYYQAGRDPALNRLAVGWILLAHTIRSALDDGVREYRFGRGDETYKYRFATEDPGVETVAVAPGTAGSMLVRVAAGARAAASFVGHRRTGRSQRLP